MRPQRRPFMVETKRTRRHSVQPNPAATLPADDLLSDALTFGRVGTSPLEDLAPEADREGALALAAQVFGEPLVAQPSSSDLRDSLVSADGSLSAEAVPHQPRVLPDLLAIARDQSEAAVAARPKRTTTRSKAKKKSEGALSGTRQAVLQFDTPEPSYETALEHGAELTAGAALGASLDPAQTSAVPSPGVGFTPIHPRVAVAASRGHRGKAKQWMLTRSERWKERRLPRVCWDKFAR
jgi:hypothetical protein